MGSRRRSVPGLAADHHSDCDCRRLDRTVVAPALHQLVPSGSESPVFDLTGASISAVFIGRPLLLAPPSWRHGSLSHFCFASMANSFRKSGRPHGRRCGVRCLWVCSSSVLLTFSTIPAWRDRSRRPLLRSGPDMSCFPYPRLHRSSALRQQYLDQCDVWKIPGSRRTIARFPDLVVPNAEFGGRRNRQASCSANCERRGFDEEFGPNEGQVIRHNFGWKVIMLLISS